MIILLCVVGFAILILESVLFSKEAYAASLFLFIFSIVGLVWFFQLLPALSWNEWIKYGGLYLAAGSIVALLKWFQHVFKTGSYSRDVKDTLNFNDMPPKFNKFSWIAYSINSHHANKIRSKKAWDNVETYEDLVTAITPRAKYFKDDIAFWIVQWPITIVNFVLEDFFLKIGIWVSEIFDVVFAKANEGITKLSIGNIDKV